MTTPYDASYHSYNHNSSSSTNNTISSAFTSFPTSSSSSSTSHSSSSSNPSAVQPDLEMARTPQLQRNHVRRVFACGLLEIRFAYTFGPFLMFLLFSLHQDLLGILTFVALLCFGIALISRILYLARYQPHRLYQALPDEAAQADLIARLGRLDHLGGSPINPTHLRLSMLDREFTPNDYEMLLTLDEDRPPSATTGLPPALIERLPTFTIPVPRPRKSNGSEASPPLHGQAEFVGLSESAKKLINSGFDGDEAECAICLEKKKPGDTVRALQCLHTFHVGCIDPWLQSSAQCPVCKGRVTSQTY